MFLLFRSLIPWLALAPAALLAACASDVDSLPGRGPMAVSVELYTTRPETIVDVVDLVGQLEAEESVMIKPETEGVVSSVEFQEGDRVEAGTLLIRLRDDEEQARLHEAEAQLALAEAEFGRAQALAAKASLSRSELDRARATRDVALARRERRKVELRRMAIRAPFDGALGARLISPGDRVDRETDLVRIDAVDRLRLLFTVPEIAIRVVQVGMPLQVTVAPWPEQQFPGEVYFVAPSLDPRNRRLLLKAWVSNTAGQLRPGLFANIRVEIARHENAIVVPEAAIAYDAEGGFVWRAGDENHVARVAVDLGIRRSGRVEVTAGLQPGDRIVSAGTHKLTAGALVAEARPSAAEPETAAVGANAAAP